MRLDPSVTLWLHRWTAGEAGAFDRLMESVYNELHAIAGRCFRSERVEHTLQATALLHEALLRVMDLDSVAWIDRGHFYSVTARMMRRILVDHARHHGRWKRGGRECRVTLEEAEEFTLTTGRGTDLLVLDRALDRLETRNERLAQIVQLRFFAGLTSEEISQALSISVPTVTRDWRRARIWLYSEVSGQGIDG